MNSAPLMAAGMSKAALAALLVCSAPSTGCSTHTDVAIQTPTDATIVYGREVNALTLLPLSDSTVVQSSEAVPLTRVLDIALHHDGTILVLDALAGLIIYNADGTVRANIERSGRGPGELWNARSVATGGDTILVLDETLKLFDIRGRYLDHVPQDVAPFAMYEAIAYTKQGIALKRTKHETRRGQMLFNDTVQVNMLDVRRHILAPRRFEHLHVSHKRGHLNIDGPPVLGRFGSVAVSEDAEVWVVDSTDFVITIYDMSKRVLHKIAAAIPRVRTTDRDFDNMIHTMGRILRWQETDIARARRAFAGTPRAAFRPAIGDLILSPQGGALFNRLDISPGAYDPFGDSGPMYWQIISPARDYVGTVALRSDFTPLAFDQCSIVGYIFAASDVPVIMRYHVDLLRHAPSDCPHVDSYD
jgi:hypothetical protein